MSESDTVALCTLCAAAASETASCAFSCAFKGLSVCCRRPCAVASPACASCTDWRAESESTRASTWPLVTCWPCLTSNAVSVPLVWKLAATSPAEATLPLAETEVVTTPRCTVAVRVAALAEPEEPSRV